MSGWIGGDISSGGKIGKREDRKRKQELLKTLIGNLRYHTWTRLDYCNFLLYCLPECALILLTRPKVMHPAVGLTTVSEEDQAQKGSALFISWVKARNFSSFKKTYFKTFQPETSLNSSGNKLWQFSRS